MIRHRTEDLEIWLQFLSHGHDGSYVAAAITVIRRGPDRNDVLRREVVFVALVDELMRACYEIQIVYVVEL